MALRRTFLVGVRAALRAPLVQAVAVGSIAVSLLFIGLVRLAGDNAGQLARGWGRGVQVIVYLDESMTSVRSRAMAEALAKLPAVSSARIVDAHEAYRRLRASLGDRGALLDGIEETLLPASIEVSFVEGRTDVRSLGAAIERLRRTPGVEDVELVGDWVGRVRAIERLLALGGLLLGLLVGVGCLFVVAATMRLGIHARREEIEILKLCGATDGFVRGPFLVEGTLQGVAGATVALMLLYGIYRAAAPLVEHVLGSALSAAPLSFFSPVELILAIPVGALLGLLGSLVAVGRYVEV